MQFDVFHNLATGFGAAVSLPNLGFALLGCLLGTLIGVLPGIGPIPTIAMLLPITFGLEPLSSLIMLAGIYYGAQYGGSTTSILVNIPGEAASIVTCLDGHEMAKQGRAGAALGGGGVGFVLRRLRRHGLHRGVRPAACGHRPGIQLARLLFADGARPRHRGDSGARFGDQGTRNGARRPAVRSRRHRRQQRSHPLYVRHFRAVGRDRLPAAGHRAVRHRRDHPQSGAADAAAPAIQRQDEKPVAEHEGLPRILAAGAARHRPGFAPGHPARRRCRARLVRELYARKEGCQGSEPVRQGRHRRAWRGRNPPTTRPRKPPSFRC